MVLTKRIRHVFYIIKYDSMEVIEAKKKKTKTKSVCIHAKKNQIYKYQVYKYETNRGWGGWVLTPNFIYRLG